MDSAPLFTELPRTLAYLDPGSGSLIVQMLIAAVVGGGLLLRAFWNKLTGKSKNTDEDIDAPEEVEDNESR